VSVWGLLTALVLAHMPVGQPGLRQAGNLAARTALLGAPIMALLFVLFPRVGPLWGVPSDGMPTMGLSNSMSMGSVAELASDDAVALRVRFRGPAPAPEAMYFRGPVLSVFDGREWRPRPAAQVRLSGDAAVQVRGEPARYEMTLEPQRLAVLPLLEATIAAPLIENHRVVVRDDLQWISDRPLTERVRFEAAAFVNFRHGLDGDGPTPDTLYLPPGTNPRTLAWAQALRDEPRHQHAGARVLAQAVLRHIRTGGYTYTLTPGLYGENEPTMAIDEFWLDRKLGFCEHFASAFVVAMRAMDVPARVVTGYQGTDPRPVDGYYIVRRSHAHAWAEYWTPEQGWVRADPTAAVAPDRVLRSRQLIAPQGVMASTLDGVDPQLLEGMRRLWEAVDNRWNQWVLNYSRGQQLDLLKNLGFRAPSWEDLSLLLISTLSALALAGAGWAWWDRRRVDPWVRQMDIVRHALLRLDVPAAAHEPPRTLARRVRERLGDAGQALVDLLETIDSQRYGRAASRRPDRVLTRRFSAAARHLRRHRRARAGF
jgi:transglutaminase-like putative cysteine protease